MNSHLISQISVKALVFNENQLLTLRVPSGVIDFPGGRVDEGEWYIPWGDALRREVNEELGQDVRIKIGRTAFVSKRHYVHEGDLHNVAAIFFDCQYLGGDIELSNEHTSYKWIDSNSLLAGEHKFISDDEAEQLKKFLKDNRGK
ncbi:MAG: NUDIX domain-containing protein [Candidatus Saccharimonadales bacterium]